MTGLNSTGVTVRDLRVAVVPVNRFDVKTGSAAGGIHVRISPEDPEQIEILFCEAPGVPIDVKRERSIENYYHREDFRRAAQEEMGGVVFPSRLLEAYLNALLDAWNTEKIREAGLRLVIDYSHSGAALLLPGVLDRLGVEAITLNASQTEENPYNLRKNLPAAVEKAGRVVESMEADLGVIISPGAEHLFLLDESGRRVPDETLLLLLMRHACRSEGPGVVVLPQHITKHADKVATELGASVVRTKSSEAALMTEAAHAGTIFAGTLAGGFIFPRFMPSMDALVSFGKVLECVAAEGVPVSVLAQQVPQTFVSHVVVSCPWAVKGAVMRRMVEELKDEKLSLMDGIKVLLEDEAWVQILPDADEPLFHLYAEAGSAGDTALLTANYRERLEEVIEERQAEEE